MSAASFATQKLLNSSSVETRPHRRAESSNDYPDVVTILNHRWRVITCRHGIQWILQYRNRAETVARDSWRGRSYCRTKEALIRVCDAHAGCITPESRAVLDALPGRLEAPTQFSKEVAADAEPPEPFRADYCRRRSSQPERLSRSGLPN
jgi:hypothetical protein